jgi:ribosome recycling factor
MTWILTHNNEAVGEWSEDLINKVAEKLKKKKKSSLSKSEEMITQKEAESILAEFLPDPIRDALLSS